MLRSIFLFEVRYQLRHPLFYLVAFVFFMLNFLAVSTDVVQVGGGIGAVNRNSPFVIVQLLGGMSLLTLFIAPVFVATSIQRDFELGTHELFFSSRIRKFDYLIGRFAGAMVAGFLAFAGSILGIALGSLMPWLDPERIGPFMASPYLFALLYFVLPNLFLIGAICFSLASLTRSLLATYGGVVLLFGAYALAGALTGDLENERLAGFLDPFGFTALGNATKYWTVFERNSTVPSIDGDLLINRAIWLGVSLAIFALGYSWFRYSRVIAGRRARRKKRVTSATEARGPLVDAAQPLAIPGTAGPAVAPMSGWRTTLSQYLHRTRLETVGVFKSAPFLVMLAFGMFNLIGSSSILESLFGTPVHPVTHLMLQVLSNSYLFFLVIIVTLYSGVLVWRERSLKLHEMFDALPVANWIPLGSKMTALLLVVGAFMLGGMLTTIGIQIYEGYYRFELGVYAEGLLINGLPFFLVCFLAVFVQVLANNRFAGYLVMILFMVSGLILNALNFNHNLYRVLGVPSAPYSDMNGYGHFLRPILWFGLYWSFFALFLTGLAALIWPRGTETGWRSRMLGAAGRWTPPIRAAVGAGLAGFVATGAYIYYNTNILNEYVPGDVLEERQAEYENRYRSYVDLAQPRVTNVTADVDIYPSERRVEMRGTLRLQNRGEEPIPSLHMTLNPLVRINALEIREHQPALADAVLGYRILDLAEPLRPGESMPLRFDFTVEHPGFVNHGSNTAIVHNGTFFNTRQYFPVIGYDVSRQLLDPNDRRKHGLPPVERMAKIDDEFARRNNYIVQDSDWVTFETTVSTSPDQIAIAPGYLQREWTEGGRRYFHYSMDAPILNYAAYLSARYQVRRDTWNDVAIEIYHHPDHTYNLDKMVKAVKASLEYFSANFSPYQHRQVRIVEFPRYARFAQSLPNTIPFSESIGFIADLEDEEAIDYVFYVTAHEVAHQWWAHQVIGGNVQGATLMVETLAQYSALMVMEQEYGRDKMRRFLKYELDNYLRNRGAEIIEEMPLLLVENQPYIHYRKGSVVMYALRDYIGEEPLNRALARYIETVGFQQPPYTTSLEFLDHVRPATPERLRYVLEDMFETITLFENRIAVATYEKRDDGTYAVSLDVEARKMRADGRGVETEIPVDDWVDVAVFGEEEKNGKKQEKVLYMEKHRVTAPRTTLQVIVNEPPLRAGVDPYNKLVDRNSDDNVRKVSEADQGPDPIAAAGR